MGHARARKVPAQLVEDEDYQCPRPRGHHHRRRLNPKPPLTRPVSQAPRSVKSYPRLAADSHGQQRVDHVVSLRLGIALASSRPLQSEILLQGLLYFFVWSAALLLRAFLEPFFEVGRNARPVANGLRTDHPIPDLPFVDDEHIPVEDPRAVEAVGRHEGGDMWGREDPCPGEGWTAFTTDPIRHDLAWVVRWHPAHGRSVVLYQDEDVAGVHQAYMGDALLFLAGGYWWDGGAWHRPPQIWDPAGERYVQRSVPAALTVFAADLLRDGGDPEAGAVWQISGFEADAPRSGRWLDHLALWAGRRGGDADLAGSVVSLAASELTPGQMIGAAGLAEIAGVAASTLRAYISRGEAEVPEPQAVIGGRSLWSRPVAEEWAEKRRSSPENIEEAVGGGPEERPPGVTELWERYTRVFFSSL
jgi:hypothetical protein